MEFTPEEIIGFARQMRDAGATYVKTPDGLEICLSPKPEPIDLGPERREPERPQPLDAMKDPATYGLPEGAPIPGFSKLRQPRRPKDEELDEAGEPDVWEE